MGSDKKQVSTQYTCNDYRAEMVILSLQRQLQQPGLSEEKRKELAEELARLEKEFGF
ncbi:MAG: hypothetical protein ACN4GW_12135 [Desulforhopalus sp.]